MRPDDALSRAIACVNLVDLINTHCPTPETARLDPERGGLIRDPRPGFEETHPSFSLSRRGGIWLWHRFGRTDERGREEGGNTYHLLLSLGWSPREAADELVRLAGTEVSPGIRLTQRRVVQQVAAPPIAEPTLETLQHAQRELERRWPVATLTARGLDLERSQRCGLGVLSDGAILIPINGPDGTVLAVKQRHPEGSSSGRYSYLGAGVGAPAWCNPGHSGVSSVLLCEGELNGLAVWSAAQAVGLELDVQGIAGASAAPHPQGLEGRAVFVHADGDGAGNRALERWAAFAREAGALRVTILEPLPAPLDFCDLAGTEGLEALGARLREMIRRPRTSPPARDFAPAPGAKRAPSGTFPFVSRPRGPGTPCWSS